MGVNVDHPAVIHPIKLSESPEGPALHSASTGQPIPRLQGSGVGRGHHHCLMVAFSKRRYGPVAYLQTPAYATQPVAGMTRDQPAQDSSAQLDDRVPP